MQWCYQHTLLYAILLFFMHVCHPVRIKNNAVPKTNGITQQLRNAEQGMGQNQ